MIYLSHKTSKKYGLTAAAMLLIPLLYCRHSYASLQTAQDSNTPLNVQIRDISNQLSTGGVIQATLGSYDISPLVTYTGAQLSFYLSGAVETGRYPLKAKLLMPDGQSIVLVEDTLTVGQASWTTQSDLRSLGTYGTADSDSDEFAEKVRRLSESALRFQANRQSGQTQISSSADIQHQSNNQTMSGDKLEVANFHLGVSRETAIGNLGLAIGNQSVEQQGLVFNGFNRRGIRASISEADAQYHASAFVINTDPTVSSKDNLLLAGTQREQSHGALFDFSVIGNHLRIGGGYINGQSELLGDGIQYSTDFIETEAEPTVYGGKSWSLIANSTWLDEALFLEAEKAWSNFDADGLDKGDDEQRASADRYRFNLKSYGILQPLLAPIGVNYWEINWQQQTVEADFFSIANIGLPGDLRTDQATLQLAWQRVQMSLGYLKTRNNVEKDIDLATQQTRQRQFSLQYTPAVSARAWLTQFLGQPSLAYTYSETDRIQRQEDALLSGYNLDDATREQQISASFQHDSVYWSIQHSQVDFNNHATSLESGGLIFFLPGPDTENRFTTLNLSYTPTPGFSLSPSIQWASYKEFGAATQQDSLNAGLNSRASLMQDRLTIDVDYNLSDQKTQYAAGFPGQDYQTQIASLMLSWKAIKAAHNNAGLTVSVRQIWNQQKNTDQPVYNSYQILLGLEIYWASGS